MKKTYIRPESCAISLFPESLMTILSNGSDKIGTDGGDVDDSDKSRRKNPIWGDSWGSAGEE